MLTREQRKIELRWVIRIMAVQILGGLAVVIGGILIISRRVDPEIRNVISSAEPFDSVFKIIGLVYTPTTYFLEYLGRNWIRDASAPVTAIAAIIFATTQLYIVVRVPFFVCSWWTWIHGQSDVSVEIGAVGLNRKRLVTSLAVTGLAMIPVYLLGRSFERDIKRREVIWQLSAVYVAEVAWVDGIIEFRTKEEGDEHDRLVSKGYNSLKIIGINSAKRVRYFTANIASDLSQKICPPGQYGCAKSDATYDPHISLVIQYDETGQRGTFFNASMCGDLDGDGIAADRWNVSSDGGREPAHCFDDYTMKPGEGADSPACKTVINKGNCRY